MRIDLGGENESDLSEESEDDEADDPQLDDRLEAGRPAGKVVG